MSDVNPASLLATCTSDVASRIGLALPAAFDMVTGPVVLDGDPEAHELPADAVAVRWPLAGHDATFVVVVTEVAADLLREDGGGDLVAALTPCVVDVLPGLAPLFDEVAPQLEAGAQVPVAEALAEGPGDAVSVALLDGGTHRATVGLRMVVADDLLTSGQMSWEGEEDDVADATPGDGWPRASQVEAEPVGWPAATPAHPVEGVALTADPRADVVAGTPLPDLGAPGVAPAGVGAAGIAPAPAPAAGPQPTAHPAEFASFDQLSALPGAARSMAMLGEVEMGVTAELGRTRLTVREVLGLSPGSIIELDRAAGSPVDVVVNGTLIARGEVVVIDEEFGIRITEIIGMAADTAPAPLRMAQ